MSQYKVCTPDLRLQNLDPIFGYSFASISFHRAVASLVLYSNACLQAGKASLFAQGKRRYDRKQAGFGGQVNSRI